jgi:hypothetical protein
MYHQIQSQYIKHYITVRTFYKKMFKQWENNPRLS